MSRKRVGKWIGSAFCLLLLAAGYPLQEEESRSQETEKVTAGLKVLREAQGYAFQNEVVLDTGDKMLRRFPLRADRPRSGVVDRKNGLLLLDAADYRMIIRKPHRAIRLGTNWRDFKTLGKGGDEKKIILRKELERMLKRGNPDVQAAFWLQNARELYGESKTVEINRRTCRAYSGTLDAATIREAILDPMGSFAEQAKITVTGAKGTVKFFLDEAGRLVRYLFELEGKLTVEIRQIRESFRLGLKQETTFTRIGFARVAVPEGAKEILGLTKKKDDKK